MGAVRCVVFDLGGVVVRICRTWQEACERAGVPVRDPDRFRDPGAVAGRSHAVHLHQTGQVSCDEFFALVAESSAGLYAPEEVRRVHEAWTMHDYAGLADLIDRLNAPGGPLTACLSNTNHTHWNILRQGGTHADQLPSPAIARLVRPLVSHELRASKPGIEIYRMAEQQLGFAGDQIVLFDDLEENVAAANSLGWQARRIDPLQETSPQMIAWLRELGIG